MTSKGFVGGFKAQDELFGEVDDVYGRGMHRCDE